MVVAGRVVMKFYCGFGSASSVLYLGDNYDGLSVLRMLLWAYVGSGWVIDGYGSNEEAVNRAALRSWHGERLYLICNENYGKG